MWSNIFYNNMSSGVEQTGRLRHKKNNKRNEKGNCPELFFFSSYSWLKRSWTGSSSSSDACYNQNQNWKFPL